MAEFGSRGVSNTALGLSIGALGVEALRGNLLGGLLGGQQNQQHQQKSDGAEVAAMLTPVLTAMAMTPRASCNEDHAVTRYDAAQSAEIERLRTEISLRDSNIYTDQKLLEVYKYFDGKIDGINQRLCDQAVWNTAQTGTIGCMAQQIAALQGLTRTVIPASALCPEAMPRYNSWVAPTTGAATGT